MLVQFSLDLPSIDFRQSFLIKVVYHKFVTGPTLILVLLADPSLSYTTSVLTVDYGT